jgi:hypothetical protein
MFAAAVVRVGGAVVRAVEPRTQAFNNEATSARAIRSLLKIQGPEPFFEWSRSSAPVRLAGESNNNYDHTRERPLGAASGAWSEEAQQGMCSARVGRRPRRGRAVRPRRAKRRRSGPCPRGESNTRHDCKEGLSRHGSLRDPRMEPKRRKMGPLSPNPLSI